MSLLTLKKYLKGKDQEGGGGSIIQKRPVCIMFVIENVQFLEEGKKTKKTCTLFCNTLKQLDNRARPNYKNLQNRACSQEDNKIEHVQN